MTRSVNIFHQTSRDAHSFTCNIIVNNILKTTTTELIAIDFKHLRVWTRKGYKEYSSPPFNSLFPHTSHRSDLFQESKYLKFIFVNLHGTMCFSVVSADSVLYHPNTGKLYSYNVSTDEDTHFSFRLSIC